jgi:hypothetical protein
VFLIDLLALCLLQDIALQVERLIIGRDARSQFSSFDLYGKSDLDYDLL